MATFPLVLYIYGTLLSSYLVNSQLPYFSEFDDQSDWTIDAGSSVVFHSANTNSQCNLIETNTPCIELSAQNLVSRTISTIGYHNIRIVIDVSEVGLNNYEWCYLRYKTAATSWVNEDILRGDMYISTNIIWNATISIPSTYNNHSTFKLGLGNGASGIIATEYCYFANLRVFGIPYTKEPTLTPSVYPTLAPSNNPTFAPTYNPSNTPSISPITMQPSIHPSSSPTEKPTLQPTNNPSLSPTIYSPTNSPTTRTSTTALEISTINSMQNENEVEVTSAVTTKLTDNKNKENENNDSSMLETIMLIIGCVLFIFCIVMIICIYSICHKRKIETEIKIQAMVTQKNTVGAASWSSTENNVHANNGNIKYKQNTRNIGGNNEMNMIMTDAPCNEGDTNTVGKDEMVQPDEFVINDNNDELSGYEVNVVTINANNIHHDEEEDICIIDTKTKGIENDEFIVQQDTIQ